MRLEYVCVVLLVFFIIWWMYVEYCHRQQEDIIEKLIPTPKIMTEACDNLNIPYTVISKFEIDIGDGKLRFNKAITNLNPVRSRLLCLNKEKCSTLLQKAQISVPKFQAYPRLKSEKDIERIIENLDIEYPLVVKPACGSSGIHVHVGVENEKELRKILKNMVGLSHRKIKCDTIMLEEYVPGDNYRILCLGDQIIDVLKREIPYVIGDGQSTLSELISRWNAHRKLDDLYPMQVDWEFLKKNGIGRKTIIPNGNKFTIKQICGCCVCNYIQIDPNTIHPSLVDEFQKVNKVLGLGFSGIDVIATDLSTPNNAKINEVNSAPSLRPHYYRDVGYMNRERDLSVPIQILERVVM